MTPAYRRPAAGPATGRRMTASPRDASRIRWLRDPLPASAYTTPPLTASDGDHPLADPATSAALQARTTEIQSAFAAIEPALKDLARRQFDPDFSSLAVDHLQQVLGIRVPTPLLAVSWIAPLDMRRLYAHCVLATFRRLIERPFDRNLASRFEGESAEELIQQFGFHAIDLTPCADGRLSGMIDHILRIPPAIVAFRKSYAGAAFDVEDSLRHWEAVEWRRLRAAASGSRSTRFLKIGAYHFSSVDPRHEGCAAHGSDEARAAGAVLERLQQLDQAVHMTHGADARLATLMIGVDTDTDALRVHVPDSAGHMSVDRYLDNRMLYEQTRTLSREQGKEAIRQAIARLIGVTEDDAHTQGMRWFCGYLLKNNLAQVAAVRQWHGASYADRGHTEQLIVIGDAVDDVQMRNLAFQAQMDTLEEGTADLDVGVRILTGLHQPRGLAVPVLVHIRFDPRIPGARERAERRALRLRAAVQQRYASQVDRGGLRVEAVVRAGDTSTLYTVSDGSPEGVGAGAELHA